MADVALQINVSLDRFSEDPQGDIEWMTSDTGRRRTVDELEKMKALVGRAMKAEVADGGSESGTRAGAVTEYC